VEALYLALAVMLHDELVHLFGLGHLCITKRAHILAMHLGDCRTIAMDVVCKDRDCGHTISTIDRGRKKSKLDILIFLTTKWTGSTRPKRTTSSLNMNRR